MHGGRERVGVTAAFDDMYRLRYHQMVRLAFVLVDTTEQAEEVVQDAFAALYGRWSRVTDPEAYLRTSVLNGARGVLRRRRLLRRRAHELEPIGDITVDDMDGTSLATASGAATTAVVAAIRRLPDRQRSCVLLRYELQLSEAEIAETLGIPAGTVKSNLHRAIARLREEIDA